jgi:hypothetical protein
MTTSATTHHRRAFPALLLLAAVLLVPATAHAQQFALFKGKVLGIWKSTLTIGAGSRSGTPQTQLVGAGAGQGDNPEFPGAYGAVGVNDDANLNFPNRGELFSAPMTWTSELNLRHSSGQGVFVRVLAWYDMVLEGKDVPHGSGPNRYQPNSRLSDKGNIGAGKFAGLDIYDAFFYGNYKAGQTRFLLRVGRQAIDWGEGIFYPGINAINPYDYAWATTTGARIANGGKRPVNRVYANVAGPSGLNIDGFFNLEFRETVFPACGTYFSSVDPGFQPGCNLGSVAGLPDNTANLILTKVYYKGKLTPGGAFPDGAPDPTGVMGEPSRWSGWGVSARKFVEPLGTELGFYYADYTNPIPTLSPVVGFSAAEFAMNNSFHPVKAFAVSASTGMRDVALSGQFTRVLDYPAARNAPAYIEGSTSGKGPYGYMMTEYAGREAPGFYPMNINQLQTGAVWQFGRHVGLSDATLAGEAMMHWNTNNPPTDGPNAERLLRGGNFGLADWSEQGYVCDPGPLANGIITECEIEGFQTPFSMGYKLRAQTTTPQFGPGVTLTPALAFGHDITGYAADFSILGGRISYGAFLRVDIRQASFFELGATWYRRGTPYDSIRDKGQYTFVVGWNLR